MPTSYESLTDQTSNSMNNNTTIYLGFFLLFGKLSKIDKVHLIYKIHEMYENVKETDAFCHLCTYIRF